MSKTVEVLLAAAVALVTTVENEKLEKAIADLEAIQDTANGNSIEYKKLKALVETIEAEEANEDLEEAQEAQKAQEEELEKEKAQQEAQEKAQKEEDAIVDEVLKEKTKKYSYAGIRMIGASWGHKKDKYQRKYATAKECAEAHNQFEYVEK